MILLHTALLCEGQTLIEKYKLTKIHPSPKIYQGGDILLVVGGVGKKNTIDALTFVFEHYPIQKAINLGVAGCSDKEVLIGALFCTNHPLKTIQSMKLHTVDAPQKVGFPLKSLFDMEGKYFLEISQKHLQDEDIYIFKVVSDYLDDVTLEKDFVKKLIQNRLKDLETYLFPIF